MKRQLRLRPPHMARGQVLGRVMGSALGMTLALVAPFALLSPAAAAVDDTAVPNDQNTDQKKDKKNGQKNGKKSGQKNGENNGAPAQQKLTYKLEVTGLEDETARDLFNEVSILRQNRNKSAKVLAELQGWIAQDVEALNQVLRANGFYAGRVSYQFDRSQIPYKLTLIVNQGTQYKIDRFELEFVSPDGTKPEEEPEDFAQLATILKPIIPRQGRPGRATAVINTETRVMTRLPQVGYPMASVLKRDVVVDHARQAMDVTMVISPGPRVLFDGVQFDGAPHIEEKFLRALVTWEEGELYDSSKVEEFRENLSKTSLFGAIGTKIGDIGPDGRAPLLVTLDEAKFRSYGVGANYATVEGFGVSAFWEHRNFLGGGEKFRVEGKAAELEQYIRTQLEIPAFRRPDQRLVLSAMGGREEPDAYDKLGAGFSATLERTLDDRWTALAGGSVEYSRIDDSFSRRNYYLVGGMGGFIYDSRDDLFDPSTGWRITGMLRPYAGQENGFIRFLSSEVSASTYWRLSKRDWRVGGYRYVLATRLKLGSIIGEETLRLPADKRLYAGGGASVRGFGYQEAGPLNAKGDPIGGRSLVEASVELRYKYSRTIGIVPFLEAGSVDNSSFPDFDRRMFVGAGIGLRYFTSFAPIRVDVAVPLNKRPVDRSYQIYISLGQSF